MERFEGSDRARQFCSRLVCENEMKWSLIDSTSKQNQAGVTNRNILLIQAPA